MFDWSSLPPHLRSYINSEQEKDIDLATVECERLGLDYQDMRRLIIQEMVRDYDANEPARERRRRAKS